MRGQSQALRVRGTRPVEDHDDAAVVAAIFVPHPRACTRAGTPGGLGLLERQLKQLRALGDGIVLLLVPASHPEPTVPSNTTATMVVRVPAATQDLAAALAAAADDLPAACLALAADRLVDLRVLRALRACDATTFASLDGEHAEPIGWVQADDVRRLGASLGRHAARLALGTIDPYSAELRGSVAPYLIKAESAAERRQAWDLLLDHCQKRSLDLPGRYFDGPFENFLVRRLAPTEVTPNQVTLATLVIAAGVAVLFRYGWLRVGIVIALVVGVLDGVDGKLARLKLATSKLGELEHVGDFLYENAWYLALAWNLAGTSGHGAAWYAGLVLVACDLVDSLLYLVVQRRTGRMLDELTTFDRRFRAIAGRRNVYVMIFAGGFFFGDATTTFFCVVGWALLTVAVHASRVRWVLATTPCPARLQ